MVNISKKSYISIIIACIIAISLLFLAADASVQEWDNTNKSISEEPKLNRIIIQFQDQPVSGYSSGIKKELKGKQENVNKIEQKLASDRNNQSLEHEFNDAFLNLKTGKTEAESKIKAYREKIILKKSNIRKEIEQKNIKLTNPREYSEIFNGIAAEASDEDIIKLRELPGIKAIYTDNKVQALLYDSVPLINATQVWKMQDASGRNLTGKDIKVAIIDTGIDYTHPDLGGGFGAGHKVIGGWDFINNDSDPMDDYGHGTHVAGIVAANGSLRGVAPDALLMAYKILDHMGNGNDSDVIAAMEMALDPDGDPLTNDGADIISMSLGGTGDPDDPMSQAVDSAVDYGVVVVVAAGNSGPSSSTIQSPGTARKAITVGATDKSDSIAGFSSRGPVVWAGGTIIKPDVLAPGVNIYSTVPIGPCKLCSPARYLSISGTSMATPMVSGTVALLLQKDPEMTPLEIKTALEETSKNLSYDINTQGYGRIDALRAANYVPIIALTKPSILVDDDLEDDPSNHTWNSIQEGIDDANSSDIVFVRNGTYKENIVISKSITLFGEDNNNTVIDGGNNGDVVVIRARDVQIRGFKITNGSFNPLQVVEMRSEVAHGSFNWTFSNFSGLWYDIDEDAGSENISAIVNDRMINANDLQYIAKPVEVKFKYSGFGKYQAIGFMGEKYFAGYTKNTTPSNPRPSTTFDGKSSIAQGQLHKVLIDDDTKRTLPVNGTIALQDGYVLKANDIDLNTRTMLLSLLKNGNEVDASPISAGETYVYSKKVGGVEALPLIMVRFDSVFFGQELQVAFVKGLFQISETYTSVNPGEKYGVLNVTGLSENGFIMKNDYSISLSRNTISTIAGETKIHVSDSDDLRFYISTEKYNPGTYEIRGKVAKDAGYQAWDSNSFAGFYYDLDKDIGNEKMEISGISERVIKKGDMTYQTRSNYKNFSIYRYKGIPVNGQTNYSFLGWQGENYAAIGGNDNRIAKVIIDQGRDEKKTLAKGETWDIGSGYTLTVGMIDARASPRIAGLVLRLNGNIVENKTVAQGEAYVHSTDLGTQTDVPVFVTYIDTIFSGATSDMLQMKYTWAISPDVQPLMTGDEFGKMKVSTVTSGGVTLENNYDLSLNKNDLITIMGNIKLRVADSPDLRYYPVVIRTISNAGSGIRLDGSENISISGNKILNSSVGIGMYSSVDNRIEANDLLDNGIGFEFSDSYQNLLRNNTIMGNGYGLIFSSILVEGQEKNHFNNSIDTSNRMNGMPVYYFFNKTNITLSGIRTDHVTLAQCSGFNVTDGIFGIDGINLYYSENNTFINNTARKVDAAQAENFASILNAERSSIKSNSQISENGSIGVSLKLPTPFISFGGSGGGGGIGPVMRLYGSSNNDIQDNLFDIDMSYSSNNLIAGNNGSMILRSSDNNILDGNTVFNKPEGIFLISSDNNSVNNNYLQSNFYGIEMMGSANNTLSHNNASNNRYGIYLQGDWYSSCCASGNNTLLNNYANGNFIGISLPYSYNNTLQGNLMNENTYNFDCHYENDIDTSNLVDGHKIYNLKGIKDKVYDSSTNAGILYCVNCMNVTIKELKMRNNSRSIYLLNTENSRIDNVTILNSLYGILMENSSSNMLTNSSIMNNSNGVYVQGAKNKFINNELSGNVEGISLWDSYENILSDNDLLSNTYNGLTIYSGGNNLIYHNNIRFSYDDSYNTSWDSGYPGGGNYWSGYYFADNFRGAYQDKPGSDGIGDVPFNIPGGANARDRYPFMRMNGWRSQLPIADCGADLLRCENVGSPVQFNGSESYDPDGAIVSYYWDFGDGMNGMDAELMHKYTSYRWNGTAYLPFIANLVVSDNDGLTNSTLQKVVIWMAGDANGDGKVNILDASLVGLKWGTVDPCADLNNDGKVNILDASIIGLNWGKIPLIQ